MENTFVSHQAMIQAAYSAFNARNIDAILQFMHPDIKWPRAWEGDYANGHDEVREYWQRQWSEIYPIVTPVGFRELGDDTLEVTVRQIVKDLEGSILFDGTVKHVYYIHDDLICQMDIET